MRLEGMNHIFPRRSQISGPGDSRARDSSQLDLDRAGAEAPQGGQRDGQPAQAADDPLHHDGKSVFAAAGGRTLRAAAAAEL